MCRRIRCCFFGWAIFTSCFFEDAKEASALLNVALTKRNDVPMCGVPYHAAPNYIAKLIKAGRRVAICDQTSEPQPGKIVSREITQIISAGTVSELDLLEAKRANYLGAVYIDDGRLLRIRLCRSEHGRVSPDAIARSTSASRRAGARFAVGIVDQRGAEGTHFGGIGSRPGLRQLRVPAGARALHLVRAFQSQIARWFRLRGNAGRRSRRPARSFIT